MNVDQLLAARRMETFTVGGVAETVLAADIMAWNALEKVLGGDPVAAWALKAMAHTYVALAEGDPATQFEASFVRNPDFDADEA